MASLANSVGIMGFDAEFDLMVSALKRGIPVILEGEAGTGKTEIGKAAARLLQRTLYRVDGDQELSTLKLQGWFDPPAVLSGGYGWNSFMAGPLCDAVMKGGLFFFNEINRAPSETINGVLTALDERILNIPRLDVIKAHDDFICIFTQNPLDRIGTNPLPQAFFDRCIWLGTNHLPLSEAAYVVRLRTGEEDTSLISAICRIVEASRRHPEVVAGGSIRAAIFMVKLAQSYRKNGDNPLELSTLLPIAKTSLLKKIKLKYDANLTAEEVVEDLVEQELGIQKKK